MVKKRINFLTRAILSMALIATLFALPAQNFAETVIFRFTGKVRQVETPLGDTVKTGDSVSIGITFDTEVKPRFAGLPWYPVIGSFITFHTAEGEFTAGVTNAPREDIVINDRSGQFNADQWLWSATSADGFGGVNPEFQSFAINNHTLIDYNIHLTDNSATAFSSDELPSALDLSKFPLRQGWAQFGTAGHDIKFSVDELTVTTEDSEAPSNSAAAPEFLSFSLNKDGSFTVVWKAVPGVSYRPWTSSNLIDWTTGNAIESNDETITFTFPASTSGQLNAFFGVETIQ